MNNLKLDFELKEGVKKQAFGTTFENIVNEMGTISLGHRKIYVEIFKNEEV